MAGNPPPMYMGRREKFKYATVTFLAGLLVWQVSHLLGKVLILTSLSMFGSAILRGRERIA